MKRIVVIATAIALLIWSVPSASAARSKPKTYKNQSAWASPYKDGWAQDRINQPLDSLDGRLPNGLLGGSGITVYIIDTGFGDQDCNGHGTFLASQITSAQYGIARNANVVGVKVLDCLGQGSEQSVINGVNWVLSNADPATSVVNMSLGGPTSPILDAAVNQLASLMPVVVAAGNSGTLACNQSPARASKALTVASFNKWHIRSLFSNFGDCVDMWAPGDNVDGLDRNGSRITMSGTSFSTVLVTASIAYLAERDGSSTMQAMKRLVCESSNLPIIDAYNGAKRPFVLWLKEIKPSTTRSDCPFLLP